jgi:2-oxoglutarate ferredoxin oxidoreductase subunit alpha
MTTKTTLPKERVVIRFAGDSGDGMQLTGDRFTNATAVLGNDLATLPAFQIHFAAGDILTPGDAPNVLVAMNPAALQANIRDLEPGGVIIANEDSFIGRNLEKAGYSSNPLTDGSLDAHQVYRVPMTAMTVRACEGIDVSKKEAERAKNMFALGLLSWMYGRPTDVTLRWIEGRFGGERGILEANLAAFRAGYNFGETTELFAHAYEVPPAPAEPGVYRNVAGATALAWGLVAAGERAGIPIYYASYPITPASELLHELSKRKNFGVRTLQAEDEIAAAGVALGASFGGFIGVTGTSGPGLDLKQETIGLAVNLELPMVIVDVMRAGPSTGMPTKTEQADLLAAMFGRHGESPIPIVAAATPSDCFFSAIEAVRIAVTYRTPVILLSDTFLTNSSEPWRIPEVASLSRIDPNLATAEGDGSFLPYARDERLARPWAVPGTPGLQHRIGGLEKQDRTGNISYDPANHQRMTSLRSEKVAGIAQDIPPLEVDDPTGSAGLLVLSWGSSYGPAKAGVRRVRETGREVAFAQLRHLNPLPQNTGDALRRYPKILVPEANLGQLTLLIRSRFLVDATAVSKVEGRPFFAHEIEEAILKEL